MWIGSMSGSLLGASSESGIPAGKVSGLVGHLGSWVLVSLLKVTAFVEALGPWGDP